MLFLQREDGGRAFRLAFSARPLSYEDKDQILLAVRDVSVEKKMQLSMKEAMVAADAANRAKSEFLSRMSHEIRTAHERDHRHAEHRSEEPGGTRPSMQRTLDKIAMASEHLLSLINDVLDISKIESGKMVLSNEPFCLGDVIAYLSGSGEVAVRGKRPNARRRRAGRHGGNLHGRCRPPAPAFGEPAVERGEVHA